MHGNMVRYHRAIQRLSGSNSHRKKRESKLNPKKENKPSDTSNPNGHAYVNPPTYINTRIAVGRKRKNRIHSGPKQCSTRAPSVS